MSGQKEGCEEVYVECSPYLLKVILECLRNVDGCLIVY